MTTSSLRVAVLQFGSRGDLQPFIPLMSALKAKGVTTEIWVMGKDYGEFVEKFGHAAQVVDTTSPEEFAKLPSVQEAMRTGSTMKVVKAMSEMAKHYGTFIEGVMGFCDAFKPHLVLYTPLTIVVARCIYDKYNIPVCMAPLFPRTPSAHFAPLYLSKIGLDLPCGLNLWLHWKMLAISSKPWLEWIGKSLTNQDLWELFFDPRMPTIGGYSPLLAPPSRDWPSSAKITGFWVVDQDEAVNQFEPEPELQNFLVSGGPPVYMGWGSMVANSPEHMARLAVESAKAAGVRAVVLGGWAKISADALEESELKTYAEQNMLFSSSALPHEWLLPQCSCAVIHGGAGTTGAVLRAGIPCIITPVAVDQFWWARRMGELNVGKGFSKHLNKVSPSELGNAIRAVLSSSTVIENAKKMGVGLKQETGPETAAAIIRELAESSASGAWAAQKKVIAAPQVGFFRCFTSAAQGICTCLSKGWSLEKTEAAGCSSGSNGSSSNDDI